MSTTIENQAQRVKSLTLTPGEIRFYRSEGWLLIPNVLPPQLVQTLRREVMQVMETLGGLAGKKLHGTNQYPVGTTIETFVNDEHVRDLAAQLMGGPSTLYMPFMAVKGQGGGVFHFHQDNQYTRFEDGMGGINLWFALTDMTPENGCLMVVPRSHLAGDLESAPSGDDDVHKKVIYEPDDFLPVRTHAGDCIAFSRLTVHGSGPNTTAEPRIAYPLQFHRDDVSWIDPASGERKLLKKFPKWNNKGVEKLTVPTGKADGH
jgi:2-oxoglutarate-dependent dioxygenase